METGGEDAYVNGEMAFSYITGLQGNNSKYMQALSTSKHIFLYDTQTPYPGSHDFNVTERDLNDYYLWPWETSVRKAKVASLMCS